MNNGMYFLFLAILEIQSFWFGEINGNICSSQQYNLSPSLSLFLDYFEKLDMSLKLLWKTVEKLTVMTMSIYWNSTCMGRKIRLWLALNAEVKEMWVENFRLFLIYKTGETTNSVSSNFCLLVFICSVPVLVI